MLRKLKLTVEVLANIFEVLLNAPIKMASELYGIKTPKVRIRADSIGGLKISFDTEPFSESVDARIAKIDSARESLKDALAAIDELKTKAEDNKRDLEYLTRQIEMAETNKASLSDELQTLKGLSALDSESVRKVLKLPTRVSIWTERVIAFDLGVAASTLASGVYEYVVKRYI